MTQLLSMEGEEFGFVGVAASIAARRLALRLARKAALKVARKIALRKARQIALRKARQIAIRKAKEIAIKRAQQRLLESRNRNDNIMGHLHMMRKRMRRKLKYV